jgi:hypothetical protein
MCPLIRDEDVSPFAAGGQLDDPLRMSPLSSHAHYSQLLTFNAVLPPLDPPPPPPPWDSRAPVGQIFYLGKHILPHA